jgi:hypothetical protein
MTKEQLIKQYTDLGINKNKIIIVDLPSNCYSITRKRIVNDDYLEIITENNQIRASIENNRTVNCFSSYPDFINVEKANKDGIIIMKNDKENILRYAYCPTE